ncbi:MAG: VapC toxin family domain ribonuclease [Phycisphaerales bacterium]|jgi:PIN domain nuclease of toxin-antitoxin system|nr:VapC toxin family domain ribonuclease [Phycisphaerales bacterium]
MILLDTYTLIGIAAEPARLSPTARAMIEAPDSRLFVSAISAWEVYVAVQKGRLLLSLPARAWVERALSEYVISVADVTLDIALLAGELPTHHADPADRIIVATAALYDFVLLTPDRNIHKYSQAKVVW